MDKVVTLQVEKKILDEIKLLSKNTLEIYDFQSYESIVQDILNDKLSRLKTMADQ